MDGRATIHVAGRPLLPVSTNYQAWDTLVNQLMSVSVKSPPEPTQSVAGPCAPLIYGLAPRSLCVTNIPIVTLSLVEFQIFL
jgi:hypothetical protein